MKIQVTTAFLALLASANAQYGGYEDWKPINGEGRDAECGVGQIVAGLCVSPGKDKHQCVVNDKKYFGAYKCAQIAEEDFPWIEKSRRKDEGYWAKCPLGTLISEVRFKDGYNTITCSPLAESGAVEIDYTDTETLCNKTPSKLMQCPEGYAMIETCNAYDTKKKYGCDTEGRFGGCSGKGSDTVFGGVCARVTGYKYLGLKANEEGKDEGQILPDASGAYIQNCDNQKYLLQGSDLERTYINTVSHKSSLKDVDSGSTTSRNKITHELNVENKITAEGKTPTGKITNELTTGYKFGVESELTENESYMKEQYNETERKLEISETIRFDKGGLYSVLSWGMYINSFAKYTPQYAIYSPGDTSGVVTEDLTMRNSDLDPTKFMLVLSDEVFSAEYLSLPCQEIAADFMTMSGEFEYLKSSNTTTDNGTSLVVPIDETSDEPDDVEQDGNTVVICKGNCNGNTNGKSSGRKLRGNTNKQS
ncbi:MAG: hypothetical protein SGILL_010475 [Bacillariaceae sp.]